MTPLIFDALKRIWRSITSLFLIGFLLVLAGCSSGQVLTDNNSNIFQKVQIYDWGISQNASNLLDVEVAQASYQIHGYKSEWTSVTPGRASVQISGLKHYYPFSARWRMKDGREYFVDKVDLAGIVPKFLNSNQILSQWQRESRDWHFGDAGSPRLACEIVGDHVLIKYVIVLNLTPLKERQTTTGVATKWDLTYEEHIVAELKGVPTQGLEFKNRNVDSKGVKK